MSFNSLTVVVGAKDEKNTLITTVDVLMERCGNYVEKILLVRPEKVSDECRRAIKLLEEKYPGKAEDFIQKRPFIGGAIRDGFDFANTSHILLLPGDMAIGLDALPDMVAEIRKNPDEICKISRWINNNSFHDYNFVRKIFNALGQIFLKILFRTKITDLTCPVQIMPTSLYKSIDFRELNFPFLEEMVLVPLRLGVKIKEFPAECFGRKEGKSSNSAKQTFLYIKTALRIRFTGKEKLIKR